MNILSREGSRGFTLVEILVVIAIIAALAALITPTLRHARIKARVTSAQGEIQRLMIAVEGYQADFGDYPPTDIGDSFDVAGNGINSGIESLVAHLARRVKSGPYFDFKEDQLANQDNDSLANTEVYQEMNWIFGNAELREYLDPWGNPFIYIHNRDYGRNYTVHHLLGKSTSATAGSSDKTANYHSLTTFQLWSVGPNGKNENGDGDDIGSW